MMACEYCAGNEKQMAVQPCSDEMVDEAFIKTGGVPAMSVCVDGMWVYITIEHCPMCGEKLVGDAS